MARASITYEPRGPAPSALYQVVHDHFETFRVQAASLRDGEGLPRFVEEEFRAFLRCGWLAGGFARFRCESCGLDRLVAFSCKGRGFCPSCGGRRMAERAAHLIDAVFPDVPVRQWVLSLPRRIRYQLAWDHDACRAAVAVFLRAVLGAQRARARRGGVADGRGGAVAIVQRFGGALNLNVHVHALVLDGVFAKDRAEDGDRPAPGHCHAHSNGFDLHAGVVVPAGQRERLERVCRYALRPPVAGERLCVTGDGQVVLQLRHRWADGTTQLVFDPVEFLGRLAVLVPRPRINLILYHGVLAPRAAWRSDIVRRKTSEGRGTEELSKTRHAQAGQTDAPDAVRPLGYGHRWADLMRRTFGFDVLACPRCGGRLRLLVLIEQAAVVARMLRHLGLPTEIPDPCRRAGAAAADGPRRESPGRRAQRLRTLLVIAT